ncbi:hypothetical protein Vspart_00739 [Vibrio spartinae]|uniref:Uncharacterized protein n=1 Tax=Vibrio spartinae TaxID=1918945 RepID=A0ABX6QWT1_9VIBR|nr:hypothetical protein Vspart_00739 [Vibrio spartinae]
MLVESVLFHHLQKPERIAPARDNHQVVEIPMAQPNNKTNMI